MGCDSPRIGIRCLKNDGGALSLLLQCIALFCP